MATKNTKTTAIIGSAKVGAAKVSTAVKTPAAKVKQDRKRFFYIRTSGRFGVLSPKVDSLDEALTVTGIAKASVTESKELSTNRHDSVVMYCEILDSIGDPVTPDVKAQLRFRLVSNR